MSPHDFKGVHTHTTKTQANAKKDCHCQRVEMSACEGCQSLRNRVIWTPSQRSPRRLPPVEPSNGGKDEDEEHERKEEKKNRLWGPMKGEPNEQGQADDKPNLV